MSVLNVFRSYFKHDSVSRLEEKFGLPFGFAFLFSIFFLVSWFGDRPRPDDFNGLQDALAISAFVLFSFATMSTAVLPRMVHNLNQKNPRRIRIPRFQNRHIGLIYTVFVLGLNLFLFVLIIIKSFAWVDASLHASLSEQGILKNIEQIIVFCILLELCLDVVCFILLGGNVLTNPIMFGIIVVESIMTLLLVATKWEGLGLEIEFTGYFQPSLILGLALSAGHLITHWINR